MPDSVDFSKYLPYSSRFSTHDMGELAVRLGSPVTFDRRGEVIWMDVCDRGLSPYSPTGSGVGNSVRLSTRYPMHGCYVLELTAGSDAAVTSGVTKAMSNVAMLRCGLEVGFWLASLNEFLWISLRRYDGVLMHEAQVRLYATDEKLCYKDAAGNPVTLASVGGVDNPSAVYHHIKLVADFELNQYVRVQYNDQEFDLGGVPIYTLAAGDISQYRIYIMLLGRVAYNDRAYLSHVIVTGNEQ